MKHERFERHIENLKEIRDKLEMDLIKTKRSIPVDLNLVEALQYRVDALNVQIKEHERKAKRYE
jgi:hypothetical protein